MGRCIRHKKDWGCIVLLDERFTKKSSIQQLSKWVRSAVSHSDFPSSIEEAKRFVTHNSMDSSAPAPKMEDAKPQIENLVASVLKLPDADGVVTSSNLDFSRQCGQDHENCNEGASLTTDDVKEAGSNTSPEDTKVKFPTIYD